MRLKFAQPLLRSRGLLWVAREDQLALVDDLYADQPTLRRVDGDEARASCPALDRSYVAAAAIEDTAMDIDVVALHDRYVRRGRNRGVRFVLGRELTGGRRRHGRWHVVAPGLELSARTVVNAAGAWAM